MLCIEMEEDGGAFAQFRTQFQSAPGGLGRLAQQGEPESDATFGMLPWCAVERIFRALQLHRIHAAAIVGYGYRDLRCIRGRIQPDACGTGLDGVVDQISNIVADCCVHALCLPVLGQNAWKLTCLQFAVYFSVDHHHGRQTTAAEAAYGFE